MTLEIYSPQKTNKMSLLNQRTTSDFLEWEKMQSLILKLERDGQNKIALLIACGCYTGLRISDLLTLKWEQVLNTDHFELSEQKTGKTRKIQINEELKSVLNRHHNNQTGLLFINRFGSKAIRVQYVNRKLKDICNHYELGIQFTSHRFRKTFGRRIWNKNNNSEKALIMLGQIFNHSSISTTKIYLGIREQEIANVYLSL